MGRQEQRSEAPEQTPNIGPLLTEARQRKGLSLADVEQATKIRKRYLEGLERDDYTVLPDAVYVQGFLKTYANYLDLDGEELSGRLKSWRKPRRERQVNYEAPPSASDSGKKPLLSPGGLAGAEKSRISGATVITIVIAVFVLAAVIGSLYYIGRGALPTGQSSNPGPAKEEPKNAAASQNKPKDNGANKAAEKAPDKKDQPVKKPDASGSDKKPVSDDASGKETPSTLQVAVRVEDSASWLQVLSDGEVAYEGLGEPGYTETFKADREVSISTGNAGSVGVEVNGQDAGLLGKPGEVLTRAFTKKAAS